MATEQDTLTFRRDRLAAHLDEGIRVARHMKARGWGPGAAYEAAYLKIRGDLLGEFGAEPAAPEPAPSPRWFRLGIIMGYVVVGAAFFGPPLALGIFIGRLWR